KSPSPPKKVAKSFLTTFPCLLESCVISIFGSPSLAGTTLVTMPQCLKSDCTQMSPFFTALTSGTIRLPLITSFTRMGQPARQLYEPPEMPFWWATQCAQPVLDRLNSVKDAHRSLPTYVMKHSFGSTCRSTFLRAVS